MPVLPRLYSAVAFGSGVSEVTLPGQSCTNLSEAETNTLARVDWLAKGHTTGRPVFLSFENLDGSGTNQPTPKCVQLVQSQSLKVKEIITSEKLWHSIFDHGFYSLIGDGCGVGIPRLIGELTDTMSRDLFSTMAINKGLVSNELYLDQQTVESGRTREFCKTLVSTVRRAARRVADVRVGATLCLHRQDNFWPPGSIVDGGYWSDEVLKDVSNGLKDAGADFVLFWDWVKDSSYSKPLLDRANVFAELWGAA